MNNLNIGYPSVVNCVRGLKGAYSREVLQKVPRSPSENPDFEQLVEGGGGEGLTPGFHPL